MRASARLLLSSFARGRRAAAGNLSGSGGISSESAIALRSSAEATTTTNLLRLAPSSPSPPPSPLLRSFSSSPSRRSSAGAGSGSVVEIATDDAFAAALAATRPSSPSPSSSPSSPSSPPLAVFQFTAKWCGPCRAISPVVDSMASSLPRVSFYKVDVDVDGVSKSCVDQEISAVPTFKFAKDGRIVEEATVRGADLAALKSAIEELAG